MITKKFYRVILIFAIIICSFTLKTNADYAIVEYESQESSVKDPIELYATGSFNVEIPAHSLFKAKEKFPLQAGETVRINASYSPNGSIDLGLIDSNNTFYSFNVANGNVDQIINIEKRGNYTFAIRNNTSVSIQIVGFIEY